MDHAFENAVARFRESLTKSQREQFAHCKKQDVERTIQDIQTRHGSQKRLKYMRRVSKFIEGMTQLSQVIEVFLNVQNTVAFVWGPIKFLLLTANTWVETLDLLLETYAEIGEAIPSLSQYPKLFGNYPFVQKHLENYYCDVLEFNRNALEVFARPGWKTVFHSSWRTFKFQFGPILSSLKRHQQLLTDEKLTALMSEIQTLRHHAEEKFQSLENEINARHARDSEKQLAELEETRHRHRRTVQRKLNSPDFYKDHEHASQMRQTSHSGDWILVDSRFQEWVELGTLSSKWFYLNGIPGAGKTILVSRIIDYLKNLQAESKPLGRNFSVIYFYFKHLLDNKRQMTHLLSGLLSQLADQDNSLLDFFYREFCSIDQEKLSLHKLCDLTSIALRAQKRCFIVIDGLDECVRDPFDNKSNEVERVLKWFEELMLPKEEVAPDIDQLCIRLLVSGQRDGHLEEKLQSHPSIQLDKRAEHGADIRSYAKIEAVKICKQFFAGREVEQDIIQKVTTRARGMFLFAKIVLDNLCDQVSAFDFEHELKAENFPEGLDKAYERVVKRVLKNPTKPERLVAEQILGWVVSAERPLRWREIQSRFCIDAEAGTANIQRKSVKSCKYLCGSLVEVGMMRCEGDPRSEGEVEIVHPSAKSYLIQTEALCLSREHARMALFCTQYLTSHPLRLSIKRDIKTHALTGYYGFHDYATAFWWNHVDKLIEAREEVNFDTFRLTLQSVAKLLKAYLKLPDMCEEEIGDFDATVRHFTKLPRNPRDREKVMSLELSTETVRNTIEAMRDGDKENSVDGTNHLPLYGSIRYKCPKTWCQLFSTGFAKSEQRNDHVNEHERPFRCSTEGCYLADIGFSTESGLSQHIKRHHTKPEMTLFPKSKQSSKRKGDICTAAEEGDCPSVKDFVATGSNINMVKRTPGGKKTPLMLAVEHGHLDVCEYLLAQGANVNSQVTSEVKGALNGDSILHAAVRRDDFDIIDLLLKQDAIAVDAKVQKLTAPELASALGYNRSLSLFKARKPQSFDFMSYLGQAIAHDQIRTAQMLLRGDVTSISLSQSIIRNLSTASDGMVRSLLSLRTTVENDGKRWPLLLNAACRHRDSHLTRRLLSIVDEPDRPDHTGLTPLEIAADSGYADLVSILLESGRFDLKRLNMDKNSILVKTAKIDSEIFELFLKADPTLAVRSDQDGATLLHHAVHSGNEKMVQVLLRMKADVNALLQSHSAYWSLSYTIDTVSITPLRMALELSSHNLDHQHGLIQSSDGWRAESFVEIAQALVTSDEADLSNFTCREELQCLALAAKLKNERLMWALIEKGQLSSWGEQCRREDRATQLMVVLNEDIKLLMAVATDKAILEDVLTTLMSQTVSYGTKRQGGFLALIRSNIDLAKKSLTCGCLKADTTLPEENRLSIEEAMRQNDEDMVQKMILRGFDNSNRALLLAAESGSMGMVQAILQTGMINSNITNDAGQFPSEVAYSRGHFAIYQLLEGDQGIFMGAEAPEEDFYL